MITSAILVGATMLFSGYRQPLKEASPMPKTADQYSAEVATKWVDLELKIIKNTKGYTPPVTARAIGYTGLTLYESIVQGVPDGQSLAGQLTDLKELPRAAMDKEYNWAIVVNTGQACMLKNLFVTTDLVWKKRIDSLENAINTTYKTSEVSMETFDRSVRFGKNIANAIFEWSKTDGGHEGYNRNFSTNFKVPVGQGLWKPTENGIKTPMQPYWGKNRLFVPSNANMPMPAPLTYSTDRNSAYFAQYMEVYTKNLMLTTEEKEISLWWADDPSFTFTPPGHSYSLANIAVKTSKADLAKAAETFCKVGIAVADAFILCWKCKFDFNNERPYTYIRETVNPNWIPFWAAPPFPGFSSGHATQSAAAAEVLTAMFGDNFAFTDNSHEGMLPMTIHGEKIAFRPRSYKSFYETAKESAMSRFLGGIHTRQDNELGLKEGKLIAKNLLALKFIISEK
jgi:PAP2 superfamily